MKRKDRDTYILSTGRVVKATEGIIGIARVYGESVEATFESFLVSEGYASRLDEIQDGTPGNRSNGGAGHKPFTPAERVELADFMIAQWQDLKRHAGSAIGPPRRISAVALDLDDGIVRMRLACGHDAELQLADPVLAVTETYALPKVGDEFNCVECAKGSTRSAP
jgi:hypothetical protein